MVWDINGSQGFESAKIASFILPYTRGRGLDLGVGKQKCWPHFIGVDNLFDYGGQRPPSVDIVSNCDKIPVFADSSMDFIFSSHLLEHFHEKDVPDILREWTRIIKTSGYLVLYLPSANLYPKVGETGANPDHKWNIFPGDIEKYLKEATNCGWTQLEQEERAETDEYSLFLVFQKRDDGTWEEKIWQRNPDGKKRCMVTRYGAIGDQLMAASILPGLKKQGWHITYNTSPSGQEILLHDPHIDEWLIQDKDQVPNQELGPFWDTLATRYDRVINLSESIEGGLLQLPGRLQHKYSTEARQRLFGSVNYLERTHDIAAVPYAFNARFYPTEKERYTAHKLRKSIKAPVIAWAINGSAAHKVYPYVQIVLAWILDNTPAHVFLLADPTIGIELQQGILSVLAEDGKDLSRVHACGGKWNIRETLAFCQVADIVVGPETGPLNAVGMEKDVAKVIYLSHSSPENLTKHWVNATVLEPAKSNCACFPCHMLHYTWDFCNQVEKTKAALCASAIEPERVYEAILKILKSKFKPKRHDLPPDGTNARRKAA